MQQKSNLKFNEQCSILSEKLADNLEEVLDNLNVSYLSSHKMLSGCCPVHGGDNPSAWNIYKDGYIVRGIWFCRTHNCHVKYKKTLLGLIRGILEHQGHKNATFLDAVKWGLNFLGIQNLSDIETADINTLEKRAYCTNVRRRISIAPTTISHGFSREEVRKKVILPAEYYINRGYSKDILDKYDIGLYTNNNRVLVPIYDSNYRFAIGFMARSIYNQCPKCKLYHNGTECPQTNIEIQYGAKWINSKGFSSGNSLYNYWFAKKHIESSNIAVIVEGAGDVWRLEEAGIHNSIAIFGINFTDIQKTLLLQTGALSLIIMTDNDEAGRRAVKIMSEDTELRRSFRLFFPKFNSKDVGELNVDTITDDIKPFIERVSSL